MRHALLLSLVLSSGCLSNVSGDINGDAGPLFLTTMFGEAERNDLFAMNVIAVSFMTDCETLMEWMLDTNEILFERDANDDADDIAEALEENDTKHGIPAEFWLMFVSSFGESLKAGDELDLNSNDDDLLVGVSLFHRPEKPDYEEMAEEFDDGGESFAALDGSLSFVQYDSEKSVRVESDELEFVETEDIAEDGEDAKVIGNARVTISAGHCPDLSDLLDDSLRNIPVADDERDAPSAGNCGRVLGADDGCDCGCGAFDSDCPSTSSSACEFNECPDGLAPAPDDNAVCI